MKYSNSRRYKSLCHYNTVILRLYNALVLIHTISQLSGYWVCTTLCKVDEDETASGLYSLLSPSPRNSFQVQYKICGFSQFLHSNWALIAKGIRSNNFTKSASTIISVYLRTFCSLALNEYLHKTFNQQFVICLREFMWLYSLRYVV